MKRGRTGVACAIALLIVFASACSAGSKASSGRLQVAVAFYPVDFLASRIGADLIDVTDLTPPGAEPHDIELKPSDVRAVRSADVVFYLGEGFQPAVTDALKAVSSSKKVDLLAGLKASGALRPPPPGEDSATLQADPHVWLSPSLMQSLAQQVASALKARLPAHAADLDARESSLSSALSALHGEFSAGLGHCARMEIFTSHAAFAYLAADFGLRQVAITGLSPDAEPSSKRLTQVAQMAQQSHATTIFFERLISPRISNKVAQIAHAKTAVLDPIEGLTGAERSAGADYFSIMRSNLAALRGALGCQ